MVSLVQAYRLSTQPHNFEFSVTPERRWFALGGFCLAFGGDGAGVALLTASVDGHTDQSHGWKGEGIA
jgi:hypothetical protein